CPLPWGVQVSRHGHLSGTLQFGKKPAHACAYEMVRVGRSARKNGRSNSPATTKPCWRDPMDRYLAKYPTLFIGAVLLVALLLSFLTVPS
ncbi:hypothetical protein MVT47_25810, partial [Salmonella sp. L-S2618]|uniref:hypothetical protein n=1 Tax=Salmonella sp. L-S2618 TaxID=2933315 RepID=UPI001FF2D537|nr:hypothetical protein [Salmonella sp. L-S2618]